ncbi:MAG: hypothetical protein ACI9TH_001882 [Kiritimatiellia bacterium]|jgi:hypothetical protein
MLTTKVIKSAEVPNFSVRKGVSSRSYYMLNLIIYSTF